MAPCAPRCITLITDRLDTSPALSCRILTARGNMVTDTSGIRSSAMVAHARVPYVTPQEYLEHERSAETKSEYYDGDIVAMAGASPEHDRVTGNIFAGLHAQLL